VGESRRVVPCAVAPCVLTFNSTSPAHANPRTVASMAMRPCLSSDSRHFLSVLTSLSLLRPKGSKYPKGAVAPALCTSSVARSLPGAFLAGAAGAVGISTVSGGKGEEVVMRCGVGGGQAWACDGGGGGEGHLLHCTIQYKYYMAVATHRSRG
jgi:hypothetical protein